MRPREAEVKRGWGKEEMKWEGISIYDGWLGCLGLRKEVIVRNQRQALRLRRKDPGEVSSKFVNGGCCRFGILLWYVRESH